MEILAFVVGVAVLYVIAAAAAVYGLEPKRHLLRDVPNE
jgi:hypothetical protein